jgi:pimeloyl-ACP methyl ester carboxylesterase
MAATIHRSVLLGFLLAAACSPRPTPVSPSSTPVPDVVPATEVPTATPSPSPQPARIEEITFQSGEFTLVGDLRLPTGEGPFPVVLFVHGSGDADRTAFGLYLPVMERMLQAGYAVFSWDKPGNGESTGQLREPYLRHQRAQIVLDAIEVMKARSDIDAQRIGLWGTSQASWVMPLALAQSKDIAFMICVSCSGMSGRDQMAFQVVAQSFCGGVSGEKADEPSRLLAELDITRAFETYKEYLRYRAVLDSLAELGSVSIESEPILSEGVWQENDPDHEDTWNPIEVIERARIPVLAIFGEKDSQGDPIQGAHAWRKALARAGNPYSRVEVFPGVDHLLGASETGCMAETDQTIRQVLQDQGYWPQGVFEERFLREPGPHTPLSAWPYAPGYLDLIEEWLRGLRP